MDGVLIDTRFSYNLAIKKTVKHVLGILNGAKTIHSISDSILMKMRLTGGFNNDTDTTYALILTSLVSQITSMKGLESLLFDATNNIDARGIISVERYLSTLYPRATVESIKHRLGYPGPVGKSIVTTVFDEVFYGTELFKQRYGIYPKYYFGEGLIDNEKVVITKGTTRFLLNRFNKSIGVVSGRSKLAFEYSLQRILSTFNKEACIFLEDEPRKNAKPNPYGIRKAMKRMLIKHAIYVGDSVEDIIMVGKAKEEMGLDVEFIGVYGSSATPMETRKALKQNGAEFVLMSVNKLPNILNKVM
ncbi:MAG TPA: HAD family hydrolase [Nitrososphaeraceae archaeon]|nr:HAD family hydrolase [Nitrososphaeraceae archaeon]